jgi:hypothetical protein
MYQEEEKKQTNLQASIPSNFIDSTIESFLPKTRCKISKEMLVFLLNLLGNKPFTLSLLYSGHIHGWNLKDFHSHCDSKGRTVSLF